MIQLFQHIKHQLFVAALAIPVNAHEPEQQTDVQKPLLPGAFLGRPSVIDIGFLFQQRFQFFFKGFIENVCLRHKFEEFQLALIIAALYCSSKHVIVCVINPVDISGFEYGQLFFGGL